MWKNRKAKDKLSRLHRERRLPTLQTNGAHQVENQVDNQQLTWATLSSLTCYSKVRKGSSSNVDRIKRHSNQQRNPKCSPRVQAEHVKAILKQLRKTLKVKAMLIVTWKRNTKTKCLTLTNRKRLSSWQTIIWITSRFLH